MASKMAEADYGPLTKEARYNSNLRHACSLQGSLLKEGPRLLQSFPPLDGGGLLQILVYICTPPPHVALHSEIVQLL